MIKISSTVRIRDWEDIVNMSEECRCGVNMLVCEELSNFLSNIPYLKIGADDSCS